MFTGLVAELGRIERIERDPEGVTLEVVAELAGQVQPGDSVAVNGCCLTAATVGPDRFTAEVMNQTLELTTLGGLGAGSAVNLELATRAGDRLGGHLVQGHVDGRGEILETVADGFSMRVKVGIDPALARYVIPQGSITIEGVSLTVTEAGPDSFGVALIPETRERTNLGSLTPGDPVNLECDVIARYVERMLSPYVEGRAQPSAPESDQ